MLPAESIHIAHTLCHCRAYMLAGKKLLSTNRHSLCVHVLPGDCCWMLSVIATMKLLSKVLSKSHACHLPAAPAGVNWNWQAKKHVITKACSFDEATEQHPPVSCDSCLPTSWSNASRMICLWSKASGGRSATSNQEAAAASSCRGVGEWVCLHHPPERVFAEMMSDV